MQRNLARLLNTNDSSLYANQSILLIKDAVKTVIL